MRSTDGKAGTFLYAATGQCGGVQSTSRLVFNRYGSTWLLSQIWTRGDNCGRRVQATRRDRELAARHKAPDETIVLATFRRKNRFLAKDQLALDRWPETESPRRVGSAGAFYTILK